MEAVKDEKVSVKAMDEIKEWNHLPAGGWEEVIRRSNKRNEGTWKKEKCQPKQWMRSKNGITYLEVGQLGQMIR